MITIRDVGPRDGLQSERPVAPAQRTALAVALADAGLRQIEAVSFVSPTAVPSMAGAGEVVAALPRRDGVTWWALVPNAKGAELALAAGVRHLTVTVSASEGYSQKNVGRSTDDAVAGLAQITAIAARAALDVVISCCFGSPFDDVSTSAPVVAIVDRALAVMPAAAITLADTTGTATPRRVRDVVDAVRSQHPDVDLGLHLHDTRGTALANALAGLAIGVQRFDTAVGGLGGSPFAPGAGGNLATEDLVLVADDLGLDTGIDLEALLAISRSLVDLVGHPVPSRVSTAGGLPEFGR